MYTNGAMAGHSNAADRHDNGLDVRVAELTSHADRAQCVELQQRVWGPGYRDSVPGSLLSVSQKVGGLVAGAFSDAGDLVGFVFGLTGLRGGRIVHWSHMLAVDPDYRDRGVGRRLKLYQRECLRAAGVDRMYWSFDPLVARNAHLNLNRLGVLVEDYVTDMYADTGSDLHAFGTDRFVASWPVAGALQSEYMIAGDDLEPPLWEGGTSSSDFAELCALRVEIPVDAESMRDGELERLQEWRSSTRSAFTTLFGLGWRVGGFQREEDRCFYLMKRPDE